MFYILPLLKIYTWLPYIIVWVITQNTTTTAKKHTMKLWKGGGNLLRETGVSDK